MIANLWSYSIYDAALLTALRLADENEQRRIMARKKKLIPPGVQKVPFYIGAHGAKRK